MNIFVGNLSFSSGEDIVRALFEPHGEVSSVKIIENRETGRSRGFGFVEMPNDKEAHAAIKALDGTELDGRAIKVNEAQSREGRPPRKPRW